MSVRLRRRQHALNQRTGLGVARMNYRAVLSASQQRLKTVQAQIGFVFIFPVAGIAVGFQNRFDHPRENGLLLGQFR